MIKLKYVTKQKEPRWNDSVYLRDVSTKVVFNFIQMEYLINYIAALTTDKWINFFLFLIAYKAIFNE